MTTEKIEGILAGEEALIPSSGFLSSVMERIGAETAVPPPIPFPWKRAIPGIALTAGVFGWAGFELLRHGIPASSAAFSLPHMDALSPLHFAAAMGQPLESVGWVALALGVSFASWLLSRRMAGGSGLL